MKRSTVLRRSGGPESRSSSRFASGSTSCQIAKLIWSFWLTMPTIGLSSNLTRALGTEILTFWAGRDASMQLTKSAGVDCGVASDDCEVVSEDCEAAIVEAVTDGPSACTCFCTFRCCCSCNRSRCCCWASFFCRFCSCCLCCSRSCCSCCSRCCS